jgi:hypothetical protein
MPSLICQDLRLVPHDCEGGRGMSGVCGVFMFPIWSRMWQDSGPGSHAPRMGSGGAGHLGHALPLPGAGGGSEDDFCVVLDTVTQK